MSERGRTTFTVATSGVGRPDYAPQVGVTHTETGSLQTKVEVINNGSVASGSSTVFNPYTVPSGYELNIGSVVVTCPNSGINYFTLYGDMGGTLTYYLDQIYFDLRYSAVFGTQNALTLEAGELLKILYYNNDKSTQRFRCTILGYLEAV